MADHVGACAAALMPLYELIRRTCSPPSGSTATTPPCRCWPRARRRTGRLWTYVRDDRPFGGTAPPAAVFFYSPRSRRRASRAASRRLCRDSPGRRLCRVQSRSTQPDRQPGPITEAACWAHARRKFFELADIAVEGAQGKMPTTISPIAFEAVQKYRRHLRDRARRSTAPPAERLAAAARTSRRWSTISSSG